MASVEVVYAKPNKQWIINLELDLPASILDAIHKSNILNLCPDIDLSINKVGIFGEIAELSTLLKHKDRVEIYRPLEMDPMTKRFQRVAAQRKNKKNKYHE
ncbi:MAG TPA: RnfH family protein [Gammaproteobacteria bacterium]|nr:RnfH family protein [Gammaproteobacteria bacterium]